jgi:hypothetical protein
MLLMGDPGSGKTGSLESLVAANYLLRVWDFDNGLDSLRQQILHRCPDKIDKVEYQIFRDKKKSTPTGTIIPGGPKAFAQAMQQLDHWHCKDADGTEVDHGSPFEWGNNVVVVLDSLTFCGDAAFDYFEPIVPRGKGGQVDPRQIYGMAQDGLKDMLSNLSSEAFKCNVIVTSHIRYFENQQGVEKGHPTAIGKALSAEIGRFFNSIALCQTKAGGRRTIQTVSTAEIDLKCPNPFDMAKELPLETGLATYFKTLIKPVAVAVAKPNIIQAKRRV